jgi:hypothetical protein
LGVEGAYTQQGRAHIRRLRPDWAARPALMSLAAHAVESKAVVRIEVAVSPRPCLGCAVELVLRVAPLRRGMSFLGGGSGFHHSPSSAARPPKNHGPASRSFFLGEGLPLEPAAGARYWHAPVGHGRAAHSNI